MKCLNCNNEIIIQLATKANCKNCNVLTNITSILTVQCGKCGKIFQIPLQSKSIMNVKKDDS